MLYLVSTPIGNLQDMTYRAVDVLNSVDLIAAEDTRHTRILTNHYNIKTPLTSYFEHNKIQKAEYLIRLLKEGQDIALVTDAGTPGISDPGYCLIRLAKEHDLAMTVVPGATALISALTLSALPSDRFVFEGFLPVKSGGRKNKLKEFLNEKRTIIFYESPHRVIKTITDMKEVFDDPAVVVARELTKKFEEVQKRSCTQWLGYYKNVKPKGEFVLLLNLKGL